MEDGRLNIFLSPSPNPAVPGLPAAEYRAIPYFSALLFTGVRHSDLSEGAMLCEVKAGGCDDNERVRSDSHSIHINLAPASQHQSCSETLLRADRYIQMDDTADS